MSLKYLLWGIALVACSTMAAAFDKVPESISASVSLKVPGNGAKCYPLTFLKSQDNNDTYYLESSEKMPLVISQNIVTDNGGLHIGVSITALEDVYFNYNQQVSTGFRHDDCLFYMPGFWYRRNLRSPKEAPSFHSSDSWIVGEDRLSAPLTGIFNEKQQRFMTVSRLDKLVNNALATHREGEIILSDETSLGHTGFENNDGVATLSFGFPYREAPKSYIRKLTLAPAVTAYQFVDKSGGSTPSATLPLVMGYKYFKDKRYLDSAKRTADYLEKELISKADYFSSTLDANCEDKEASLYAATATYYLALVTKGAEHKHYADLTKQAAYFALSWYYLWDVPFAPGQMLGDIGLKSRGWGNVSVENNHIDVFVFEFADVLRWLSGEYKESRFSNFAEVISTSMRQLLPYEGHMCGIAKTGYYPEVVQHTNWDYGKNGKGYYNDIFAPGWTVASLWELLTPGRAEAFMSK